MHDHKLVQHRDGKVPWCEYCRLDAFYQKPKSKDDVGDLVPLFDFQIKARGLIVEYFNDRVEKTDDVSIHIQDVYVVWFSKTLQNWKAMLSTTISDGMYYEVTYNGDREEAYIDAYKKFDNVVFPDRAKGGV